MREDKALEEIRRRYSNSVARKLTDLRVMMPMTPGTRNATNWQGPKELLT